MSYVRTPPHLYMQQADAVLNQANPTSALLYTVLATTSNVRVTVINIVVTWTVQPTPLEIVVTIDGRTLRFYVDNPATATNYFTTLNPGAGPDSQILSLDIDNPTLLIPFMLEGRSVRVQARTTGGTVQNLSALAKYATKA